MKHLFGYPGIKTIQLGWSLDRDRENKAGAVTWAVSVVRCRSTRLDWEWGQEPGEVWLPLLRGPGLRGSEPNACLYYRPGP